MLRHTHPLVKIRESVNPLIAVYKTSRFIVSLVFTGALIFCPIWQRLLLFCLPAVKLFVPSLVLYFSSSFLSSHSLFCCYGDLKKKAMATLDDKLLGEKLHYYCSSSSESEPEDEDGEKSDQPASLDPTTTTRQWDGTSCNVLMQTHSDVLLLFFFTVFFFNLPTDRAQRSHQRLPTIQAAGTGEEGGTKGRTTSAGQKVFPHLQDQRNFFSQQFCLSKPNKE